MVVSEMVVGELRRSDDPGAGIEPAPGTSPSEPMTCVAMANSGVTMPRRRGTDRGDSVRKAQSSER